MLWVLFLVPLAPALRYSPLADPEPSEHTVKAARARLLGLCGFLPPALLPDVLSFLFFSAGLRLPSSPRAPFLPLLVLPASLPSVLFSVVGSLCCLSLSAPRFCVFLIVSCKVSPHVSLLRLLRMAEDNNTHTPATLTSSLSPSSVGVGLSLNSFICCFGLAVLLLGPSGTSFLF